MKLQQLERLMSENPNRVGGSLTEGDSPERLLTGVGKTTRPLPEHALTEDAQEALKDKMRARCPSKIRRVSESEFLEKLGG